jgi:hypothetical protein
VVEKGSRIGAEQHGEEGYQLGVATAELLLCIYLALPVVAHSILFT